MIQLKDDFINDFKRIEDMVIFLQLLFRADENGNVRISVAELSNITGYSVRTVRTSLSDIQNDKQTTNKTTNKNTLITICNYDSYKVVKKVKRQTERQTNDKQNITQNSDKETRFQRRMAEVYPNVAKLKEPLTLAQYNEYLKSYSNEDIKDVLLSMENYKELAKKYVSANLTLGNWLKRRL